MEKKEIIKQLELLRDQIGDLQGQLNEVEKPKFEVDKWYKNIKNKAIWYIESINNESQTSYGINRAGSWSYSGIRISDPVEYMEATNEEVKARLIEYWEKDNEPFERYSWYNNIFSGTDDCVFYFRLLNNKGEWVHSNPKKRTLTIEQAEQEFNIKICK